MDIKFKFNLEDKVRFKEKMRSSIILDSACDALFVVKRIYSENIHGEKGITYDLWNPLSAHKSIPERFIENA